MFVVGLIFFSLSFSFSLSLSLFFPVLKSELFPGHTDRVDFKPLSKASAQAGNIEGNCVLNPFTYLMLLISYNSP